METNPLVIIIIWYKLLCFSNQINYKVCWWITQLQIWVAMMIIRILLHVPKQWGEMVLLPFFCTFPNVSLYVNLFVTATLIVEALLKSFYSRCGFKVIIDFATSTNFKQACKLFYYEPGNYRALPKQIIGLQCNITIPRRVTIIPDNRIEVNENSDVFKDLNEAPPSDDWFSCEYIDAEANKKV